MNERSSEKAQRLRLRFARSAEATTIGHLDLARCWEHAFEEGGIAVSYSGSRRAQPRITVAAGLLAGATSEGELLDVVLARRVDPAEVVQRVAPHLSPGLELLDAREVGMGLPSLPSAVRWADYEVDIACSEGEPDVAAAIDSLLAAESFPWEDTRGEKVRRYDLRPLVQDIRIDERCGERTRLWMRLRCDSTGVGRPDQVAQAVGQPQPVRVHRLRLVLSEVSPARDAWRRRGRFVQ